MKTLIRFASLMEALPHLDPVDPRLDQTAPNRFSAFAGFVSPSASPQA